MSRTPIDLTGQRFGRLVAIRDVGSLRAFRLWLFRCDCGNEIERTSVDVRHGKVRSCGCLARELSSKRRSLELAGKRFGRLIVAERVGADKHGHVAWRCLCDCGNEKVITGVSLNKGATRSCGCLHSETIAAIQSAKALPPEIKRANVLANAARQRMRRKSDPLAVMQARLSRLHRHALAQVGAIKSSPTFEQLGYTAEDFVAHIERQFARGMGWHNMSEWQIDHIIPVSEAKTEADVVALNQLSNLRPMWAKENNAKKAKRVSLI
jgi:hypothetical protein